MAARLSADERALFEAPSYGVLATYWPDGTAQVTPVWVDLEDDTVIVNTAEGRVKVRNLRRDPRATVTVMDREDWERWASVRGRVVEITTDGALEQADRVSRKYTGHDFRQLTPGEVRLRMLIEPESVTSRL
jgi:PPOX class probable F420-dependent enzyme